MSRISPPRPPTGVLYRVDGESLNTLIEKYEKSLTTNTTEQEKLEKLKQEYVSLKSRLATLPQHVEYNALVPIGRRALCPGKIIHTNEIMCLLGDNWFVECSAVKAIEIANHRIAKLDEQYEGLKKERELINNWKQEAERQLVETIGEGTIEIREDYDENHEKVWRERHRESLRRHHQQLAKEREEAKQEKSQDDDLWSRLDELEIREELEDYLEQEEISEEKASTIAQTLSAHDTILAINQPTRSNTQQKDRNTSSTTTALGKRVEETVTVSEETLASQNKTDQEVTPPAPTGKRVKFSTDNIIHDISDDINYSDPQEQEKATNDVVTFTDDCTIQPTYPCFDPIQIRFRHTTPSQMENDEDADCSGTEEEDQSSHVVSSPGDIVKVFGPTSINAISNKPLPKSILKPYAPPLVTDRKKKAQKAKKTAFTVSSINAEDEDVDLSDIEPSAAMSKIVTERVPIFTTLQLNDSIRNEGTTTTENESSAAGAGASKPMSLFKMRRQQEQLAVMTTSD